MDPLNNNEDCDFAKYFKNLGYEYSWDFSKRTGEYWHEIYKDHKLMLQVEMCPLEAVINDFCTIETTSPEFWIASDSQEKYDEIVSRVREFEASNKKL